MINSTMKSAEDDSDAKKDKLLTIGDAEKKIEAAELGEWVTRYTLIKLMKICPPKQEATIEAVKRLTERKSLQKELSAVTEMKILSEIITSAEPFISTSQLSRLLFTHKSLFSAATELCHHFGEIEISEHYGEYIKVKVPKRNKTVGSLFGIMETFKLNHEIQDYSVSQTTLEQIFHDLGQATDANGTSRSHDSNGCRTKIAPSIEDATVAAKEKSRIFVLDEKTGHLIMERDEIDLL